MPSSTWSSKESFCPAPTRRAMASSSPPPLPRRHRPPRPGARPRCGVVRVHRLCMPSRRPLPSSRCSRSVSRFPSSPVSRSCRARSPRATPISRATPPSLPRPLPGRLPGAGRRWRRPDRRQSTTAAPPRRSSRPTSPSSRWHQAILRTLRRHSSPARPPPPPGSRRLRSFLLLRPRSLASRFRQDFSQDFSQVLPSRPRCSPARSRMWSSMSTPRKRRPAAS